MTARTYHGHTQTRENADLDALVATIATNGTGLAAEITARAAGDTAAIATANAHSDAALAAEATTRGAGTIPVVASTAVRDATYPAPTANQRVLNLGTGDIERYTGSLWVPEFQKGQKRPRTSFGKVYASVSAPSLLNVLVFGDSVAEFKPRHICSVLERTMGSSVDANTPNIAGTARPPYAGGDCNPTTTTNYTLLTNQWTYWPDGNLHQLTAGGSATWIYQGGSPKFTKVTIYYIAESGGGSFTVNIGGVLQATINTNNSGAPALGIYSFTQAVGTAAVVTACTAGTVKIVEVHKVDASVSGVNYFPVAVGGIALNDAMSTSTGRANLQTYITDAAPDLVFYEMKEQATPYADATTYATRLAQLGAILDAGAPTADIVLIGSTPIAVNDADMVAQNVIVKECAVARGYIYFDGYTPVKDYATLVALGWNGDGTHVANQCSAFLAALLFQDLGFDRLIVGLMPRAVNDRGTASQLAKGTTIGPTAAQQIKFTADSFGLDWQLLMPRSFFFTRSDGTLIAQFADTTQGFANVLPMNSNFDISSTAAAPSGAARTRSSTTTGVREIVYDDLGKAAPSLLHMHTGCFMAGPYTVAQLPPAGNHNGYIAYTTDGGVGGGAGYVIAVGASWVAFTALRAAALADAASANATDLASAITLVNELKSKLNTLLANRRTVGEQA